MGVTTSFEFELASSTAATLFAKSYIPLSQVAEHQLNASAEQTIGVYLDRLVRNSLYLDAVRIMAHALPIRRALWWTCLALRKCCDVHSLPKVEQGAIRAAAVYVADPTEANRLAAEESANLVAYDKPAYLLARAAGYMDLPIPAPRFSKTQNFRARGVHDAIWLALGQLEVKQPDMGDGIWLEILAIGLDISRGDNLWPGAER